MPPNQPVLLIVDDNPSNLNVLRALLEQKGYKIAATTSGRAALKAVAATEPTLILLDIMMPDMDGFEVCRRLKADTTTARMPIIFITARDDTESIVKAFQQGGVDYVTKPFNETEVLARIENHLKTHQLTQQLREKNRELQEQIARREQAEHAREHADEQLSLVSKREAQRWGIEGFIGKSPTIGKILGEVNRLQRAGTVSVLITGESGTGKELIARAIHLGGPRAKRPLVAVNCSAIPKDLAESEFFGHVKGAFTGATSDRKGNFELADGGTLFLDEVGDMPLTLQAKLLRVLEDGVITPVGGTSRKQVNVRVLSATNADFQAKIAEGAFRQDLYYRLAQFTVVVPPLRERREDVPLLAEHFLNLFANDIGVARPALTPAALEALAAYNFPGNVRELKNIIVRALIESDGGQILPDHLLLAPMTRLPIPAAPTTPLQQGDLPLNLAQAEIHLIQRAIDHANGNITQAAALLGVDRKTIYRKLTSAEPKA